MSSDQRPLLKRLWVYQNERFPLSFLLLSTGSAVLSTLVISYDKSLFKFFLALVVSILFLFHLRVFDEFKDFEHDNKNYPDRPIQRGLITKSELAKIGTLVIAAELIINILFNRGWPLVFFVIALGYTLLTRMEFWMRSYLRPKLLFYNFLHYLQFIIFQLYIYATFWPVNQQVLPWHYLVIELNVLLLEWVRKVRSKEKDYSRDTYSWRVGHQPAAWIFAFIISGSIIATALVVIYYQQLWLMVFLLALLLISMYLTNNYIRDYDEKSSKRLQAVSAITVLVTQFIVVIAALA